MNKVFLLYIGDRMRENLASIHATFEGAETKIKTKYKLTLSLDTEHPSYKGKNFYVGSDYSKTGDWARIMEWELFE